MAGMTAAATSLGPALRMRKRAQLERFTALRGELPARYAALAPPGGEPQVEPEWAQRNAALAADVLPEPGADVLRHPSILYSMFMPERCVPHELPLLVEAFGDRLAALLEEDPVGDPPLVPGHDGSYATSSNSVHHLFHLERFARSTGCDPTRLNTVVEWGAGYGNLAKLFRRLHGGAPTYVAIDTPLFSCLQWLYLASVLGPDAVHLAREPGEPVVPYRINLVPAYLAGDLRFDAQLFISTWALNESPATAQDLVVERAWFGAEHLLLGMHEGVPLADRAIAAGARAVPVGEFLPGQNYIVR
jgi:hypothetical protein